MTKLVTEREMDIAVMEAYAQADELHETWKTEFIDRRAVVDLARRKKAKMPMAQPMGAPTPQSSAPAMPPAPMPPQSMTGGGGYAQ